MVSHIMLCIFLHLNSQYASQQIEMQKAETVLLLILVGKQIDQILLQSYCCEVVMAETYLVLRGRFSKVLNLSSPVGFSDGLSRREVPLKCQIFQWGSFTSSSCGEKWAFSLCKETCRKMLLLYFGV